MNTLSQKLAGIALLLASLPIHAITLSLNPVTQTVTAGSSFEMTLTISGLGDGTAPSVGAFDLNVGYDPTILDYSSVVFGDPILGDQLDLGFGSLFFDSPGTGTVNLFEVSMDTIADNLNNLQADSFTLATLSFNALSAGTSSLGLTLNALSDASGDALQADLSDARVTVDGGGNGSIPEPATWLLIGLGTLGMFRFRQKTSRSHC